MMEIEVGKKVKVLLRNLRIYSTKKEKVTDLRIGRGRILESAPGLVPHRGERVLNLSGYMAFPGLINAHDHLALNLFPRLGNPPYENFYQWAEDVYHPRKSPVKEILQVPQADRLWWGAYKNLISGVTTVVHHNPYHGHVLRRNFPVRVLKKYGWSHSLRHDVGIVRAFRKSRGKVYMIHAAEGVDRRSSREIDALFQMGVMGENTVVVHGVAIGSEHLPRLSAAGVCVIWCPASNIYLFGETADIPRLRRYLKVALGTDSTLSGSPTLLDELRAAHQTGLVAPDTLLEMVTTAAAEIFRFDDARGTLHQGAPADLFLLPDAGGSAGEILLNARPQDISLVLVNGEPRLADEQFSGLLELGMPNARIGGCPKWIYGNLKALKNRLQSRVSLKILQRNLLWSLIDVPISPLSEIHPDVITRSVV